MRIASHASVGGLPFVGCLAALALAGCTIEGSEVEDGGTPFQPDPPAAPYQPPTPQPKARRLVILHTNDEHSHLLGFAPNSVYPFLPNNDGTIDPGAVIQKLASGADTMTSGGIVRRQYLINLERATASDPVLLVSAGDVMMGTVFHAATASGAPDYLAMALLGYDFATLGNHEFDFGPGTLAQSLRTVNNFAFGGGVPIVISNISFDDVDAAGGDSGADLAELFGPPGSGAPLTPWAVKTMANGLRVGVMGIVGYDAALVSPGKGSVAFSVPEGPACGDATPCTGGLMCVRSRCVNPLDAEGHVQAIAGDLLAVLGQLEQANPDVIILLSHSGPNEEIPIAQIIAQQAPALGLPGIDVLVSGHSHEAIPANVVPGTSTILAQAGSYGRLLGKITIEVAPDGAVSLVQNATQLMVVDHTLDTGIFGDTDLTDPFNPKVSKELERALTVTGAVVAPVVAGLNAQLGPLLGAQIFDTVVTSNHPVLGERPFQDHPLFHLVTDAVLTAVSLGGCLNTNPGSGGKYTVAVQASGVIRESLHFSPVDNSATLADVFRVLPLGASPFEAAGAQAPGFPVVMFDLDPVGLFAGLNIGVTQGLQSDSFFLSYAGMRVTYNPTLAPFNPATFNPGSTAAEGRVTKIEMGSEAGGYTTVYEFLDDGTPWALRWSTIDPAAGRIRVLTNLYLAGYLDAFGLTAYNTETGDALPSGVAGLASTVLCQVPGVGFPICFGPTPTPAIDQCITLNGGAPGWALLEAKEWGVLLNYITLLLGGAIPDGQYDEASFTPRVIDETAP